MIGSCLIVVGGGLGRLPDMPSNVQRSLISTELFLRILIVNVIGGLLRGVLAQLFLVKGGAVRRFACSLLLGSLAALPRSRVQSRRRIDVATERICPSCILDRCVVLLSIAALFVGTALDCIFAHALHTEPLRF